MTKTTKFVASTQDVKAGVDILVEDFGMNVNSMGIADAVDMYVMEAINGSEQTIAVVSDDMNIAQTIAAQLNDAYTKEMELMKTVNQEAVVIEENVVVAPATVEEKQAATIAKSDAAQKFLANHKPQFQCVANLATKAEPMRCSGKASVEGGLCKDCAKAGIKDNYLDDMAALENKTQPQMEESQMNNQTQGTTTRRRLSTGAATQENTAVQTNNEKVETQMTQSNTRKRLSSNRVTQPTAQPVVTGRRRLVRSESIKTEFKKFEGPWYLNASMYPVLERLDAVLETLSDAELGIETIALVEPQEISRYRNRTDITVVIQIKSNGNILEFPIKENTSANSTSDLNSTSIGWIETKNGMRPAFGFWRPNEINVKAKCTCGQEFKANTGNVYCPKCKTRHADADVAVSHKLGLEFDGDWTFQTVPNLVVPRETLALIMAIAQYDAGLDMWGVIAE